MKKKIAVIGSGFSGLTASATLAQLGHEVHVFEKNSAIGGRARQIREKGFLFDMGPSWYWMPEVFEKYFNKFGYKVSDLYNLKKLDPGFRVIYGKNDVMDIPEKFEDLCELFETIEKGSASRLRRFMTEAEYKYKVGINDLVYMPGLKITELLRPDLIKGVFKLQVFSSFSKHVRKYFKDPRLISLMEFPVLFLGAKPQDTPALYSLMNYAGLKTGTFYPMGGFGKVIDALQKVCEEQGVNFHTSEPVESLEILGNQVVHARANGNSMNVDGVIGAADYHHIEQKLLPEEYRNYNEKYWSKKTFAPSSLIFYLGINKKVDKLLHHNLFFDESLDEHAIEIYDTKVWPAKPLFYACVPSKTDAEVAPEGWENIFLLIPIAVGLEDTEEMREKYYHLIMKRLEDYVGSELKSHVIYKKSFCVNDFVSEYNSYKGNAYGLANTLAQTANLKPRLQNKRLSNLFYSGQLTVPGPGVPPSIISGQVAAQQLTKLLNNK